MLDRQHPSHLRDLFVPPGPRALQHRQGPDDCMPSLRKSAAGTLTARLLSPPNPVRGAASPPPASTRSHGRRGARIRSRDAGGLLGEPGRGLASPRGSRGQGLSLCIGLRGQKDLGQDSPRKATEPSRGAAILLSRSFPGDRDLCASHWLVRRGP